MKIFLLLISISIFYGCATVDKRPVETLPETKNEVKLKSLDHYLKRKVAIARFSNETNYGKSILTSKNNIGEQASDILMTKLVKSKRFIVLEHDETIKKITNLKNSKIPADYLIVGSVSEFGRKTIGETGVFSRTKKQKAYAKVFIRLVKVSTGEVIYAEEGSGEAFVKSGTVVGVGKQAGYDSTLNDKAIEAAISKVTNKLINNIMDQPWRSYILDFSDGAPIISGGNSQGVKVGTVFNIYKKGKVIKNPQTGGVVELPGKLVGKLKVLSQAGEGLNEISICKIIEGDIDKDRKDIYYIAEIEK